MPDPLASFTTGSISPFLTSARTGNTALDLLRRVRARKNGRQGAPQLATPQLNPATLVYTQPSSTIPLWGVVTPTGLLIDPATATNDINASRTPGFTVGAPTSATDPIFILHEPGVAGRLARAVASGVAVVEVLVTDADHRFAVPIPGDVFKLISAENGPARLLDPNVVVGTSKTLVLLGAPRTLHRPYCDDGVLVWQESTDGGLTWETLEELGVPCDEECGEGSGSGENSPIYYRYKTDCERGYNVRRKAPVYFDPCTRFQHTGPWEFDSYQGCCECEEGSGSGYDCVDGECVEVEGGTFPTEAECVERCEEIVRWDCVDGTCVESETGLHGSLEECETACTVPECCAVSGWCLAITGAEGVSYPPETPVLLDPAGGGGWQGDITPGNCVSAGEASWVLTCTDGVWQLEGPNSFHDITFVSATCTTPATLVFTAVFSCLNSAAVIITVTERFGDSCEGVVSECCSEQTIPSVLWLTQTDASCCLTESIALIYDAAGFDGEGWYSAELECNGGTIQFRFYCDSPEGDGWGLSLYCNGSMYGGGGTGCDFETGVAVAIPSIGATPCCTDDFDGVVTS